jgi:hypothetical protein
VRLDGGWSARLAPSAAAPHPLRRGAKPTNTHLASTVHCVDDEIIEWLKLRERRKRARHFRFQGAGYARIELFRFLAPNGHADPIEQCPLLGEQRKTSARSEYFAF